MFNYGLIPPTPAISNSDDYSIVQMVLNLKKQVELMQEEINIQNAEIEILKSLVIEEW